MTLHYKQHKNAHIQGGPKNGATLHFCL